jgi:hypothetical protein
MLIVKVGIKSASASAFWVESSKSMSWAPIQLPDRLTAQVYNNFLDTVPSGLLQHVPPTVRKSSWNQHDGAPAHCKEYMGRGSTRKRRKLGWKTRAYNMSSSVARFNSDRTREEAGLCSPMTIEHLLGRFQAAVITADTYMLWRVWENTMLGTAVDFETVVSKTYHN